MSGGFNLTELMIVVLIIGILAAIAVPSYVRTQERARVQEAIVALKLIRAGEEIYQGEYGGYYGADIVAGNFTGAGSANTALRLDLNETDWDYAITAVNNAVSPQTFTANATRPWGAGNCVYQVDQTSTDPAPQVPGNCP